MGTNYNIHGTAEDAYYYCPNNECACNDCDAPFTNTLDDIKHECAPDCYICTYDDPTYYHGAYRLAYDEYQSAKRRNNESGEPYIRYI